MSDRELSNLAPPDHDLFRNERHRQIWCRRESPMRSVKFGLKFADPFVERIHLVFEFKYTLDSFQAESRSGELCDLAQDLDVTHGITAPATAGAARLHPVSYTHLRAHETVLD